MTMRHAALALLALLITMPVASACSLAYEPAQPATFTLQALDGSSQRTFAVGGRMLGADCSLSNPFLRSGDTFAWLETEWNPAGRYALLQDLGTGNVRRVELRSEAADRFGLWEGKLLYLDPTYRDGAPPLSRFVAQDVETGALETLPFPEGNYASVTYDGPRVVALLRTNGHEGPDELYVYDVETRRFLVEGRSLADVAERGVAWLVAAGDGWIAMQGDGMLLHRIADGETRALAAQPHPGRSLAIFDGHLWGGGTWGEAAWRMALPDGEREEVAIKGPVLGFVEGYAVSGQFSPPEGPRPDPVEPRALPSPAGPSLLGRFLLGLLGPIGLIGALLAGLA